MDRDRSARTEAPEGLDFGAESAPKARLLGGRDHVLFEDGRIDGHPGTDERRDRAISGSAKPRLDLFLPRGG